MSLPTREHKGLRSYQRRKEMQARKFKKSAFLFFAEERRKTDRDIKTSALVEKWKSLPQEHKEKYIIQAQKLEDTIESEFAPTVLFVKAPYAQVYPIWRSVEHTRPTDLTQTELLLHLHARWRYLDVPTKEAYRKRALECRRTKKLRAETAQERLPQTVATGETAEGEAEGAEEEEEEVHEEKDEPTPPHETASTPLSPRISSSPPPAISSTIPTSASTHADFAEADSSQHSPEGTPAEDDGDDGGDVDGDAASETADGAAGSSKPPQGAQDDDNLSQAY